MDYVMEKFMVENIGTSKKMEVPTSYQKTVLEQEKRGIEEDNENA